MIVRCNAERDNELEWSLHRNCADALPLLSGRLNQFLSGMLRPIHQLLARTGDSCLACGKRISVEVPGYPELCLTCYASIPWIIDPRCPVCGRHVGCPDCSRGRDIQRPLVMNRSSVAYNAAMRQWLALYKYRGHEAYSAVLARMMGRALEQMKKELGLRGAFFDAVTFVPLSEERWGERGFNQAEELARGAALAGGNRGRSLPLLHLLARVRHTGKQSFKSRNERLKSMQGVFQALPHAAEQLGRIILRPGRVRIDQEKGIRLLLVDDVYTTGSTMNACAAVLQHSCAELGYCGEIYGLTWARS